MSLFTYLLYYRDKSAARSDSWRTQESTLHLCALLGGWPGALLAQKRLRHKTRKQPFQFIYWVTVLASTAATIWMYTDAGSDFLHALLGSYSRFPFDE
nr:DUF1294 domain-containing protein [uncultured Microbulbifer sp.]